LHFADNKREQGPGPEIVTISPSHDALMVTLDLYGAVGFSKLSTITTDSPIKWRLVRTSLDNSWGTSFPDRGQLMTLGDRDYYLVCNAGPRGGSVLIDVAEQRIAWRHALPPGMETPVFFPKYNRAVTVCSGKTKRRAKDEVEKSWTPQQSVYAINFSPTEMAQSRVQSIHMPGFSQRIASVDGSSSLALVACGQDALVADTLVLFDAERLVIVDHHRAIGTIQQFATK
ncbi:MAG: hypothetical protein KDB23_02905, partial [Planctomycetales bacterium]|nr:hypothetical protein [Planctomycetales bacterium]